MQAAHIWSKGQGGPSVVENGVPLCQPMHTAVDGNRDKFRYEWFDPDQIAWLREVGWVDWDDEGQPFGRGMRRFWQLTSAQVARRRERVEI